MFGIFGSDKKKQALDSAREAVSALCGPYIRAGTLFHAATSDAYIAGFLSTRIANMGAIASQEYGLDRAGAQDVGTTLMMDVFGGSDGLRDFASFGGSLRASGDPDYLRGQEVGRLFMKYISNQLDVTRDPDFARALDRVQSMGIPMSNDIGVPLAGLDAIWFHDRMTGYG